FLKLFWPRDRRSEAHFVCSRESANLRHSVLGANIRVSVAAAAGLLLGIEWVQRSVKGFLVSHLSGLENFRHVCRDGFLQFAGLRIERFAFLVQRFELFFEA